MADEPQAAPSEARADPRAGVDLDTGEEAADLRDQPWHERDAAHPQCVGDAMEQDRVQAGVEQRLGQGAGGGVVLENRSQIIAQDEQLCSPGHGKTSRDIRQPGTQRVAHTIGTPPATATPLTTDADTPHAPTAPRWQGGSLRR